MPPEILPLPSYRIARVHNQDAVNKIVNALHTSNKELQSLGQIISPEQEPARMLAMDRVYDAVDDPLDQRDFDTLNGALQKLVIEDLHSEILFAILILTRGVEALTYRPHFAQQAKAVIQKRGHDHGPALQNLTK